ncbi:arylamine N-acetyltransferase [Bacillus cereus]|uniref:arylamine N-acetyltransferase n=1 Tax=Bacillus cereus TaxID=1396 RepID=UPI003D95C0F3
MQQENYKRKSPKNTFKKRGGVCYELNLLFSYFLIDCGFNARKIIRIANQLKENDCEPRNGHVMTMLIHEN